MIARKECMEPVDEITVWIRGLSAGDQRSAEALWRTYFDKLVRFARQKLDAGARRQADEEDVALSAMHSFYRGVQAGRYENLAGRDELWRLLVTIAAHKVSRQRRKDGTLKRGGGRIRGESVFLQGDSPDESCGIEQVLGSAPTPELAAIVAEGCQKMLADLDESLRQIALLKLEGFTNDEIAGRLDCSTRGVERKLNRIRKKWSGA